MYDLYVFAARSGTIFMRWTTLLIPQSRYPLVALGLASFRLLYSALIASKLDRDSEIGSRK